MRTRTTVVLLLMIDAVIFLVCLFRIPSIQQRSQFPFSITSDRTIHFISSRRSANRTDIQDGDALISIDGWHPQSNEELQFVADRFRAGESVEITAARKGTVFQVIVTLEKFYPTERFLLLTFFVGGVMVLLSALMFLSIPHEPLVFSLHNIFVSLGATLMLTWGYEGMQPISWIRSLLFFILYLSFGTQFYFFSRRIHRSTGSRIRWMESAITLLSFGYGIYLAWLHQQSLNDPSLGSYREFERHLFLFRSIVIFFSVSGLLHLGLALRNKLEGEEKVRLQVIIGSIIAGGIPYALLSIIPLTFFGSDAIPEEISTLFFLIIPIGLSIAFIRFNLLNFQTFVRRKRIALTMRLLIIGTLILCISFIIGELWRETSFGQTVSIGIIAGTLTAVLLPFARRFERFVDEHIFATRLNFRQTLSASIDALHACYDRDSVLTTAMSRIASSLPLASSACYVQEGNRLRLHSTHGDCSPPEFLDASLVLDTAAKHGSKSPLLHATAMLHNHFDHLLLIGTPGHKRFACIGLRLSLQGDEILAEDVDYLAALSEEIHLLLERMGLQEEIIVKQNQTKQLQELDALRSYFVSSISHDLRVPLTSIKMFTEMILTSRRLDNKKQRVYLRTISGEADRLYRMVENILSFAAIERGTLTYTLDLIDLRDAVTSAMSILSYEIARSHAKVIVSLPKRKVPIKGNHDALIRVLINLVNNAIIYSSDRPAIAIGLKRGKSGAVLTVSDRGIGISPHDQNRIFERFYRVTSTHHRSTGGAGIGLSVVAHIVEQHHGTIRVESKVGQGTTFTITIPIGRTDEKNTGR